MQFATVVFTHIAAFIAGVALDIFRQIGASWNTRRIVRNAIQVEIHGVLVHLNFYILEAIADGPKSMPNLDAKYFPKPLSLISFEYYWKDRRDDLLQLPEWPQLKGWADRLSTLPNGGHPTPFEAVMLLFSLTISPMDRCINSESRRFVREIVRRPEVVAYRNSQLAGNRPTNEPRADEP